MTTTIPMPTICASIWPRAARGSLSRGLGLALVGTLLLTISAKLQVPFYPVPLTFQTLVVLVLGLAYGWRLGGATVALYLVEGAVGLPVFAGTPEKGLGIAYMTGPTGGYLLGFLVAAVLCGWLAERGWDRRVPTAAGAMLLGNLLIYALGLLWLGSLLGWDKPILEWGLFPFLYGDLLKVGLGAALLPLAWKILHRA